MGRVKGVDREIYIRDKCICQFCGFNGTERTKWRQLEICQLIPPSKGGKRTKDNAVVACHRCRQLKHAFDPRTAASSNYARKELIKVTKVYIKNRPDSIDELDDFNAMMKEIDSKRS
jgi:5-methylcytosine-specific restriction endonuclease McrA